MLPTSVPAAIRAVVGYQAEANLLILGFNLVPAFPLDGGRVARALLWWRSGDVRKATDTAAGLGRAFGYLLIAADVLLWLNGAPDGLWFAVIGFFLVTAASAERVQQQVLATFTGVGARELMSRPAVTIPSGITLAEAQRYFARYRYTALPLTDSAGRAVGVLSIDQPERTPPKRWPTTMVQALVNRDPALLVDEQEDVGHLLEQPAFQHAGRARVVDEAGHPIGVVSVTDIQRTIRATRLDSPADRPRRLASHS